LYPYRVFVSYSREDLALVNKLQRHLKSIGALPMFDQHIKYADRFSEEIRRQISYAHIFITLITEKSKESPWVLQEIGYAMGLRVPVLPLALDQPPAGMAGEIMAFKVDPELEGLNDVLSPDDLSDVVKTAQRETAAMLECTEKLCSYLRKILQILWTG